MKKLLLLVLGSYLFGCASKTNTVSNTNMKEPCNETNAVKVVESFLQAKELYEDGLVAEVIDSSSFFKVIVTPKESNRLGGGGEFVVGKKNCKILDSKLYQ